MAQQPDASIAGAPVVDLSEFDGAAFDLDGVITRTATVHAAAWKELFDAFLEHRTVRTGESLQPFDIDADYPRYVDGRPRYDGVREFLESRGIELPDGTHDDSPERETVCGLGNRKNVLFLQLLAKAGVQVFDDSIAFVRRVREACLKTAIVSSSENTAVILASASLTELFDVRVDGIEAARLGLMGKPAADTFLYAAQALGIAPERMLGVEDSLAGVEAIRAAGFGLVIGVDRSGQSAALAAHGATMVVSGLGNVRFHATHADGSMPPSDASSALRSRPFHDLPAAPGADAEWTLVEDGFTLTREHEVESLFAIANGKLGSRGSLAEGSKLSAPATFVSGVFDGQSDATPGLAIIADWTHLSLSIAGQPVNLESGKWLEHRRTLDFRQAILFREWRQQDAAGRVTRIRGLRFASAADRHLLIQAIAISPENYDAEGHLDSTVGALATQQTATGTTIVLAATTRLLEIDRHTLAESELMAPRALTLKLGNSYSVERVIALHTSRDSGDPSVLAREHAERASRAGMAELVGDHLRAWNAHWSACDVRIEGDRKAQQSLRFAIYHLLSAANPDDDRVSIGARGLTGTAYQGHVFWDTDIFMLPFFTLTYPKAARALLGYRYRTLPAARRRAARFGYRGALYAWESADTGDDVTPPIVIQPDGAFTPVLTGEQEHHISADVAYGAWNYWRATGDQGFLLDAGAEILVETARFWASRAGSEDDGRHHIRGVIGPDEYHETVDDNAYTNAMAKWNLRVGDHVARLIKDRWPGHWTALSAKLGLDEDEPAQWLAVANRLYTGLDEKTGLIEQFRGYFDLDDIDLDAFEQRNAPMDVLLGRERLQRSRIIKQPDVVMLLHLLWDEYPPAMREANFRYYEARCAHGSSLSPAIHALIAARLGDAAMAMRYFQQAMDIDLADNMGNAAGGVHVGALGALWQAAVFGFGGLHLSDDGPALHPHLPVHWRGLSMRLMWQGQSHDLKAPVDGVAGHVATEVRHE